MNQIITLEASLKLPQTIFVDTRSPSEYAGGHIPGAVNVPLFDDEERALIGTLYKQVSVEDAKQKGLAIVSTKLPDLVNRIRSLSGARHGTIVVYCWRGGMRSKSLVSVLDLMGIKAYQLLGGYKTYRTYVLETLSSFDPHQEIVVICGSTGVGKTTLLNILAERGEPVIDLERLANHRGSAFGGVGLGKCATAQSFDADLLTALERLTDAPYLIVECESKRIGNVYLPDKFHQAMQRGRWILVQASQETRISRLIEEYTDILNTNQEQIADSIEILRKRLGNKRTNRMLDDLRNGRLRELVGELLSDYYDPLYGYENSDLAKYFQVVNGEDLNIAAEIIRSALETVGGRRIADSGRIATR